MRPPPAPEVLAPCVASRTSTDCAGKLSASGKTDHAVTLGAALNDTLCSVMVWLEPLASASR
jgi:hypothetical protein